MPEALVCHRIADHPIPNARSRPDRCYRCAMPVWVAYSSPAVANKICMHCFSSVLSANPDIAIEMPTIAQITDIKGSRGRH